MESKRTKENYYYMQDVTVNILGVEYRIKKKAYKDESSFERLKIDGYCDSYMHLIVYCDLDTDERWNNEPEETKRACERTTIRHELIHAFLQESGLRESAHGIEHGWATDEEIVDWIAIQSPKIFDVFKELDLM